MSASDTDFQQQPGALGSHPGAAPTRKRVLGPAAPRCWGTNTFTGRTAALVSEGNCKEEFGFCQQVFVLGDKPNVFGWDTPYASQTLETKQNGEILQGGEAVGAAAASAAPQPRAGSTFPRLAGVADGPSGLGRPQNAPGANWHPEGGRLGRWQRTPEALPARQRLAPLLVPPP